ncbi:hypothetical protein PbDSM24746_49560 [Paenibacillus macerans]|nr:hypothetical protein PbDSM24746_49560 [Paenibacillus macerans]GBK71245.1 hypothetical protein PbJCM17693_49530 [Paenibacillus macerans]
MMFIPTAVYIGPFVFPVLRIAVPSMEIIAVRIMPPPTIEMYTSAIGSNSSGSCSARAIGFGTAISNTLRKMPIYAVTLKAIIATVRASSSRPEPIFCAITMPAPLAMVANSVVSALNS